MIKKIIKGRYLLLIFICFSCSNNSCRNSYISNYLLDYANDKDYEYCELYNDAISGEKAALRNLSLLSFNDGLVYEHGAVILEMILIFGEDYYIDTIKGVSSKGKNRIYGYISAGFDFTKNSKLKGKRIKEVYPKLFEVLRKEKDSIDN